MTIKEKFKLVGWAFLLLLLASAVSATVMKLILWLTGWELAPDKLL